MSQLGFAGLRVGLVGPLPPPAGGMANQTRQLAELLQGAGATVRLVQSNAPYVASWLGRIPVLRALARLLPYLYQLWRAAGRSDVLHVMANSGWSWHLFAVPAIWIGWWRRVPVVVNYRGGEAAGFLARSRRVVSWSMARAARLVVPSGFLQQVFGQHGMPADIVPNMVDLQRFHPASAGASGAPSAQLLVARNLEPIYDNETALRAFQLVLAVLPTARLTVAGSGPELGRLQALAGLLGIAERVVFSGRLDRDAMAALYRGSTLSLNPSLVDNTPNSVLEAMASGVPVVSTRVGGVPFIVEDGASALLVPPRDPPAMAAAALRLLQDPALARRLAGCALRDVQRYTWEQVAPTLAAVYRSALPAAAHAAPRSASGSLYTAVVSKLVFPLHERLKSHASVAVRRRMEQSQWWPAGRLQALQFERLRGLLADVAVHVPYYRDLFARTGFDPSKVESLADLQRLPFLDKAAIRANTGALKHAHATGLARFNTGGSSGEPLVFFIGRERVSHDVAAKWRATRWWGVDIGDPEVVVWGSPIELGAQDRVRRLRDALLRTELLPAFEMSDARLDGFIAAIRRRRPKMLFGYPSALSHIARHAVKRGIDMTDLGIRVAFVTSERLYDEQRSLIAGTFGCRVANGYGGRDAGFIAHECPSGGMHLTAEDMVVELVGRDGHPVPDGEPGEIVVTHLATRDFPFIRYRTGDVAVRDPARCACGRGLPVLREIQGRSTDFVVAADGTVMHGLALIYILRDLPGVQAFKVVQHDLARTSVQVVAGAGFDSAGEAVIVQGFKRRLGAGVAVDVQRVASIAPERSGKFRYVVSHVDPAPAAQPDVIHA